MKPIPKFIIICVFFLLASAICASAACSTCSKPACNETCENLTITSFTAIQTNAKAPFTISLNGSTDTKPIQIIYRIYDIKGKRVGFCGSSCSRELGKNFCKRDCKINLPGTYTVEMTAYGKTADGKVCCDTETMNITVANKCDPKFTYSKTCNSNGCILTLKDVTPGIKNRDWLINNKKVSSKQNVNILIKKKGNYNVCLTVYCNGKPVSVCQTISI